MRQLLSRDEMSRLTARARAMTEAERTALNAVAAALDAFLNLRKDKGWRTIPNLPAALAAVDAVDAYEATAWSMIEQEIGKRE